MLKASKPIYQMTLITTLICLDLTKQRSLTPMNQHFIQKFQAMTFIVPDHVHVICLELGLRASSRVPNAKKQMKAQGRRPTAFICLFDVFGTRDEARSPSFQSFRHVLSNETIENFAVTCFLLYCIISMSSLLINKIFH